MGNFPPRLAGTCIQGPLSSGAESRLTVRPTFSSTREEESTCLALADRTVVQISAFEAGLPEEVNDSRLQGLITLFPVVTLNLGALLALPLPREKFELELP